MRPSNWDRPRFGQRDWGRDRFDMSFQNQGEDNKRQQSPFGMFGPQRTTEPPPIVGQIPGQIGRNRGFGQRGDSGNDKQPRPPSLPPMPLEPNPREQVPGMESDLGGTESSEVPMSTQPSLDQGPTQVGQRERMGPGQIGRPREIATTQLPQQPTTQYPDESEENYDGFGDSEASPLPPPPVARNPNQVGQRRPPTPGRRSGQGETSPWSQPGMGEAGQTVGKQLTTPGRFGSSEDERRISSPWKPPVDHNPGETRRGREKEERRNMRPGKKGRPSFKDDDELQSNEELEPEYGVSKQRQIPTPPQRSIGQGQNKIGQRRDIGSDPQQTPGYQDLGQRGYSRGVGQRRGMRPVESEEAEPPYNQESEMESNEAMGKVVGALQPRGISTPPQPSVVQVQNQIGQRRGTGSVRDRGPAQHDPRQSTVGQNPIHPATARQSMEAGRQIGGPRYSGATETQAPTGQVPRQFGQRRGMERRVSAGRNVPGSQQYPSGQDPNKVGDAEVITSPTFHIRNRGDSDGGERSTPPRPTVNHRREQGSGEQGDLEGVETRGVSRPPRG